MDRFGGRVCGTPLAHGVRCAVDQMSVKNSSASIDVPWPMIWILSVLFWRNSWLE